MKMKHAPTFEGAWMRGAVGIGAWLALPAACAVGPDYQRPPAPVPAAYAPAPAGWKPARPSDELPRGAWWQMFGDPTLDGLEAQIAVANQTLKAAEAQFAQARAQVDVRRAGLLPTIGAGLAGTWNRQSQNKALFVPAAKVSYTDVALPIDVSYELDVWGRVRRTIEAARADAQASAADLEAVRLSLHAELAIDYFDLRTFDAELRLLQSTVGSYTQALALAESRHAGGIASGVDVAQARAQLDVTRAQAIDVEVARSQREHAIAVIVGRPPSSLRLPPADDLPARVPVAPVGLPSELLERRPDIAAAERRMAAANAQIGVAKAAYFPQLTLGANTGFRSSDAATWLTIPSYFWSIGPALAMNLFDAGLRRAQTAQAIASYDATVANYRQTTLTALADVEDNLAALRILEEEAKLEQDAVDAARQSLELTVNQYKAGTVSFLNVVTVQAQLLAEERNAVNLVNRRLAATVALVRAIGGGWQAQ
jgi:NodT family efflux transporter outer membrane factor (OMF) lipoprotein